MVFTPVNIGYTGDYYNPINQPNHTASTWARLALIIRKDGYSVGVTDFDQDIKISLTIPVGYYGNDYYDFTFYATSGLNATATNLTHDLSIDNIEMYTIISDLITEEDLILNKYDQAKIQIFVWDWLNSKFVRMIFTGILGQNTISYDKNGAVKFSLQVQSLDYKLAQKVNQITTRLCPKIFGSNPINTPNYVNKGLLCNYNSTSLPDTSLPTINQGLGIVGITATGAITNIISNHQFNYDFGALTWNNNINPSNVSNPGYFSLGTVTFTSGRLKGVSRDISNSSTLDFQLSIPFELLPDIGDTFTIVAGCNKTMDSCVHYNNILNFLGFYYLPGIDTLAAGSVTVLSSNQSSTF